MADKTNEDMPLHGSRPSYLRDECTHLKHDKSEILSYHLISSNDKYMTDSILCVAKSHYAQRQ